MVGSGTHHHVVKRDTDRVRRSYKSVENGDRRRCLDKTCGPNGGQHLIGQGRCL
ncbi:uncharacterized protein METZ01_LOCUS206677 [marine metagenome]|uniref:Uncharacterized protein n=1 Tax=marine metagenome TaxID=408172 RepID=A0A382EV38_9ZZZZ